MIIFQNVHKRYPIKAGVKKIILRDASFTLPRGRSYAVLGVNGAGKSTLIRMIAGVESPTSGRILRDGMRISWPLGFASSFHGSLSGRENCRFVARIYGCPTESVIAFVEEFAELGRYFDVPVRTYSSGMRARLAFGLSMAIDFDVYLVDEITAVGDARFQERCATVFEERRKSADVIMVSHSPDTVKRYCDTAMVLHRGEITLYDTMEEATAHYGRILSRLDG